MKVEIITEFGKKISPEQIKQEYSSDHLSTKSIENIALSVSEAGYEAHVFGGIPELTEAYSKKIKMDKNAVYLNISNGMTQPSRRMQAPILCEMLGLNYSGSTPSTVALMNNKYFTKKIVKDLVNLAKDVFIDDSMNLDNKISKINHYPIIVKPNGEGGSYGICQENVVFNQEDAAKQTKKLLNVYSEILLEELIPGTEITNLIIGNRDNYLLNEIVVYKTYGRFEHKNLVRDNKIKTQNISETFPISAYTNDEHLIRKIKKTSVSIFEKLGCHDIARVDYKISIKGELVFLEINSNPNLYSKYIDIICKEKNISYADLLSLIIKSTCKRYNL